MKRERINVYFHLRQTFLQIGISLSICIFRTKYFNDIEFSMFRISDNVSTFFHIIMEFLFSSSKRFSSRKTFLMFLRPSLFISEDNARTREKKHITKFLRTAKCTYALCWLILSSIITFSHICTLHPVKKSAARMRERRKKSHITPLSILIVCIYERMKKKI